MKALVITFSIGLFAVNIASLAEAQAAGDCVAAPGKNCVDLCTADPGNGLNSRINYETLWRREFGSCAGPHPGERCRRYRVRQRRTWYHLCTDTQQVDESEHNDCSCQ